MRRLDGVIRPHWCSLALIWRAIVARCSTICARVLGRRRASSSSSVGTEMPCRRPSDRSMAHFLESRRSVLTLSLAATAMDAGLTTMFMRPALVSARCSTNAENPASYAVDSLAPGNHGDTLAVRPAGSALTVAVFTICLLHTHVTAE